jgi:hypothetical protein
MRYQQKIETEFNPDENRDGSKNMGQSSDITATR